LTLNRPKSGSQIKYKKVKIVWLLLHTVSKTATVNNNNNNNNNNDKFNVS